MSLGFDPIVVAIGPLAVRWFGLLALVGLGVGVYVTLRQASFYGVERSAILAALPWALPVGVLSARFVHVVGWWDYYLIRPAEIWQLGIDGLSLWGGLAGGACAAFLALRRQSGMRKRAFDTAALGVAIAIAVGRLGAFLDGHGQGVPSDLPWATFYTHPLAATPDFGVPRHPVQLYDGLLCVAIAALLARVPLGWRAATFGSLYAAARVTMSGFYLDSAFLFGWQIEQIVAAGVGAGAILLGLRSVRRMHVTLFLKPGCHLCEDAVAELSRLQRRYPHQLETIDITNDPVLVERYGERIPVLRVGQREYAAPLMRPLLERALQSGAA